MRSRRLVLTAAAAFCLITSCAPGWASSLNDRMSRALKQVEKKDFEAAVASFTEILQKYPTSVEAFLNRAEARIELRDLDGALSDYDQALKINPNYVEVYIKRGVLKERQNDLQAAIADYTEALRISPKNTQVRARRASAFKLHGDYEKAIEDCTVLINIDPEAIDALIDRADAKSLAEKYESAITDYNTLFKKHRSKVAHLHYNYGHALELKGDAVAAKRQFDEALDYHSHELKNSHKNSQDYIQRGLTYVAINQPTKAVADFENALVLTPDDCDVRYQLGHLYYTMKQNKKAIEQLNAALKIDPLFLKAAVDRALCYFELDDFDDALKDLDKVLAVAKSSELQLRRALVRLKQGDSSAAAADLSEVYSRDPKVIDRFKQQISNTLTASENRHEDALSVQFLQQLSLLEMADNANAAEPLVKRAIAVQENILDKSDPRIAYSLMLLGRVQLKQGHPLRAEALFRSALATLKNNSEQTAKYAIFNLEDVARSLMSTNMENAGSILFDTRMARAVAGVTERAFVGEASARAEQAITAFKLKKKNEQEREMAARKAAEAAADIRLPDGSIVANNQQNIADKLDPSSSSRRTVSSSFSSSSSVTIVGPAGTSLSQTSSSSPGPNSDPAVPAAASASAAPSVRAATVSADPSVRAAASASDSPSVRAASASAAPSVHTAASASVAPPVVARNVPANRRLRDKWALVVGISDFRDPKINLHYPAKDARDFADFLVKEKDFAPDHVQLLTDRQATRANILSLLGNKWLPRVAEPDDLVIIYFSGHGSASSLDVGGVNYLVAHDTDVDDLYSTAIAMQDLTRIVKERVHSERVMIVLDACHSGAVAANAKGLGRSSNVDVDALVQGTGQLVLSSSSPDQESWESTRYQGSVFTKHLLDGLRRNGRMTSLGDAYTYLTDAVQREVLRDRGKMQNPVMKSKWEGQDLVIGVPPSAPSPGLFGFDLPDTPRANAVEIMPAPVSNLKPKSQLVKPSRNTKVTSAKRAK